jgi:hypothetical protein
MTLHWTSRLIIGHPGRPSRMRSDCNVRMIGETRRTTSMERLLNWLLGVDNQAAREGLFPVTTEYTTHLPADLHPGLHERSQGRRQGEPDGRVCARLPRSSVSDRRPRIASITGRTGRTDRDNRAGRSSQRGGKTRGQPKTEKRGRNWEDTETKKFKNK